MKRAAIYARVSTTQQVEEGSSLESQVATLSRLAFETGYEIPREFIFEEDWSGEDLERPQLDRLRTVAREGLVSAIFVYSNDRLSRDPLHFLLLVDEWEKNGIEIFFAHEPLDTSEEGKLIAYVRGYASKLEAIRIRERTRRGLRSRAERGLIVGGYRLYGYDYLPGKGPGRGRRVVNDREAEIVRRIFKWVVKERMSARQVALRLQEEGVPTPRGAKAWRSRTVLGILHRRDYAGSTHTFRTRMVEPTKPRKPSIKAHRKKTSKEKRPTEEWVALPGVTPAILSEEVFEAAQRQLRSNAKRFPQGRKHRYLLSGHIRCACGRAMWGHAPLSKYRYYRCPRTDREYGPERCRAKAVRAEEIENLVWAEIERALTSPEVIWGALEGRERMGGREVLLGELLEAEREIERLEKQERNLIYLYRVGEYDKKLLEAETRRLKKAQARAFEKAVEVERRLAALSLAAERRETVDTYCEWARSNLKGLDFDGKRLVLEGLDVEVSVDGDEVAIRGILPVAKPGFYVLSGASGSNRLERLSL